MLTVKVGHSDTDHTTCLNVPSIGLVVAGDVAYNDVHLYLAESNIRAQHEWISAHDKIESLKPHPVVAEHKRPTNEDNPTSCNQSPESGIYIPKEFIFRLLFQLRSRFTIVSARRIYE